MIEIIPNWHPIFVHFTVALFSTSVILYLIGYSAQRCDSLSADITIAARWCLWLASLAVIPTIIAGFYAYNTVNHDGISHAAMTVHRNWALPTAASIIVVSLWSIWRFNRRKSPSLVFIIVLIVVQGLLLSTAWHGGELVYRYGLGVMSLPQHEGEGHEHHEHAEKMSATSNEQHDHKD